MKEKILSKPKTKYYSLAPNYESDNYKNIDEMFENALDEKKINNSHGNFIKRICNKLSSISNREFNEKKNTNIAIMGGYGSGKSSFIYSFFNHHKKYKFIVVSLGSIQYNDNNEEKELNNNSNNNTRKIESNSNIDNDYINNDNNSDINTDSNIPSNKDSYNKNTIVNDENDNNDCISVEEVEKRILQQIIYSVDPYKLPYSNYVRKDYLNVSKYLNYLSYAIVITFSFIMQIIYNTKYIKLKFMRKESLYILSFICILALVYEALSHIRNIKLNFKISSTSLELSKIGSKKDSILNNNIDELLYYFKNSKNNIVVFEDFDRVNEKDAVKIFSRLREINNIINSSIHGKSIQFIYVIKDGIFNNPERRTKFFDFIVPVKPYAGIGNNVEVISELLKKNNQTNETKIDRESIKEIANYLNNERMINDFINEYNIYYNSEYDDTNNKQLAFLILYKIKLPTHFEKLFFPDNIFDKYFKECKTFTQEEKEIFFKNHDEIDNFEKYMIQNDIINPNYIRFISVRHNVDLSIDDENKIVKIRKDVIEPMEYNFDDYNRIFDNMLDSDFLNYSSFNLNLLKIAMNSNRNKSIADNIGKNLNLKKLTILLENENQIEFFKKFPDNINNAWKLIGNLNNLSNDIIDLLILYTIEYANPSTIEETSIFMKIINNQKTAIFLLENHFTKIKKKILNYNIKYDKSIDLPTKCPKMLKLIYKNNMYEFTKKHIFPISIINNLKLDRKKMITSIMNLEEDEPLRKKMIDELDKFIILLDTLPEQSDSDKILNEFIKETELNIDEFKKIINKENIRKNISLYDNEFSNYLIENDKYEVNWENLIFIHKLGINLKEKQEHINSTALKLSKHPLKDSNLKDFLLHNEVLNEENFEATLSKMYKKSDYIHSINNIPNNYIEVLAENEKIILEGSNNFLILSNNNELKPTTKASIIAKSLNFNPLISFDINQFSTYDISELLNIKPNDYNLFERVINYNKISEIKFKIFNYLMKSDFQLTIDELKKILSLNYSVKNSILIFNKYKYLINNENIKEVINKSDDLSNYIFNSHKRLNNTEDNRIFAKILLDCNVIKEMNIVNNKRKISLKKN